MTIRPANSGSRWPAWTLATCRLVPRSRCLTAQALCWSSSWPILTLDSSHGIALRPVPPDAAQPREPASFEVAIWARSASW